MHAYCYASGQIKFGRTVPTAALPIAEGPPKALRSFISGVSRCAYDGKTLLVPGIPECQGDQVAALDALLRFTKWIATHDPKGITIIHSNHRPRRKRAA